MTNKNNYDRSKSNGISYLFIVLVLGGLFGFIFRNLFIGLAIGATFGLLFSGTISNKK